MKRRTKTRVVVFAVLLAIGAAWPAVASLRVVRAHAALVDAKASQHSQFFANADLDFLRSLGPVLKRPWRPDIRLYYLHSPRFSHNFCDAWAVCESSGEWYLKIHC